MSQAPVAVVKISVATWFVLGFTFLVQFLFAGLSFGFASLQLLLEADGVFDDVCVASTPTCTARTDQFVLLYTVSTVGALCFGYPVGSVVDAVGPVWGALLGAVSFSTGLVLLAIAPATSLHLYIVAQLCLALGTPFLLFISFHVAFIVPPQSLPMVLSFANNLFDASAVMYLLLYQVYAAGVSRRNLFLGYAALCVTVAVSLMLAWLAGPLKVLRARQQAEKEYGEKVGDGTGEGQAPLAAQAAPRLHGKSMRAQVRSFEFAFCTAFATLMVFLSNSYLGLNKTVLENLGDAQTGYIYTRLFSSSMPVSCIFAPFVGRILQLKGFVWGYGAVVLLCCAFLSFMMVPMLPVQVPAFLLYSCFRSFLYSVHFSFVGYTFGSRTSSAIVGLTFLITGAGQVGIFGFSKLVNDYGQGRLVTYYFLPMFAIFVPCAVVSVICLRAHLRRVPLGDCKTSAMLVSEAQAKAITDADIALDPRDHLSRHCETRLSI